MELNLRIKIKIKKRVVFLVEVAKYKLRKVNKVISIMEKLQERKNGRNLAQLVK